MNDGTPIRPDSRRGRILWFRLFINDFLGHTAALSPAAMGAYARLLCRYIQKQAPPPDDDEPEASDEP